MSIAGLLFAWLMGVSDPLLGRMAGQWTGEGERVQAISGRHIRIQVLVNAVCQADRLDSHNEITETSAEGGPKTYVRDYWIRPDLATPGAYELGQGIQVGSHGHLEGGVFDVEQLLGGEPPYVIRSRTRFTETGSEYAETVLQGERELSHTLIRYGRQ